MKEVEILFFFFFFFFSHLKDMGCQVVLNIPCIDVGDVLHWDGPISQANELLGGLAVHQPSPNLNFVKDQTTAFVLQIGTCCCHVLDLLIIHANVWPDQGQISPKSAVAW